MPRSVVTGGAGFLPSHLCDRLLAAGHEVVALDNFITGSPDNLAHLTANPKFTFIEQDVCQPHEIEGAVDFVFHMASPASPVDFTTKAIEIMMVNSEGTHQSLKLALAKSAVFLMASTSEVYGDPLVHPQPEEYWGNVNPIGIRSVYDESKRFSEALIMAYRRFKGVDTKIFRIFNSVLAHETICAFQGDTLHLTSAGEFADRLRSGDLLPESLKVPAFDPATGEIALRDASAYIEHPPSQSDAFRIRTRYGRDIHTTGDHSIFRRGADGAPEAIPVRALQPGDKVALAGFCPMQEKARPSVNVAQEWLERAVSPEQLWEVALVAPEVSEWITAHWDRLMLLLLESGRFAGSRLPRNTAGCCLRRWRKDGNLPLAIFDALRREVSLLWPSVAKVRNFASTSVTLHNKLLLSDDFLWFLGLFLAEGTIASYADKGTYLITLCTHTTALDRAQAILEESLGVRVGRTAVKGHRGPTLYTHSKLLCWLMGEVLGLKGLSAQKRIPAWVMQLPQERFVHFLEGYREGDGTHSGKSVGRRLEFNTVSKGLATDLIYSLLRFGIVAFLGKYDTKITSGPSADPDRRYPFYRITVQGLESYDILQWSGRVPQRLQAGRFGDLVWAPVKAIEPVETTALVYDFSVPECENFVAGTGILAHNTYGPRMRLDDGRVVPNFIGQALRGDNITVYGTGTQTRSFCYVADLVEGIYRLSQTPAEISGPINLGNPTERTMLEFAQEIKRLTESDSEIVYEALKTADDPKQRRPDSTKAKEILGWEPKVSLEDGLRATIEYFKGKV